jgi:hypothetical protein
VQPVPVMCGFRKAIHEAVLVPRCSCRSASFPTVSAGNQHKPCLESLEFCDTTSTGWLGLSYFDTPLRDGYWALLGCFTWCLNPVGAVLVSSADVRAVYHLLVYTTFAYHRAHCAATQQELLQAVHNRRTLDSYNGGLAHTRHCAGLSEEGENATASVGKGSVVAFAHRICGLYQRSETPLPCDVYGSSNRCRSVQNDAW